MNRHTTSGRWGLGITLALFTTAIWGLIPVILKVLIQGLDPYSITFYRFLIAAVLAGIAVIHRHDFKSLIRNIRGIYLILALTASVSFAGSYILYPLALEYVSPSTAQVLNQLSYVFMLVGGVAFYHERLGLLQAVGGIILFLGMLLFFNERFDELLSGTGVLYSGIILIMCGAVCLAAYTLIQKQLLLILPSEGIMFLVYIAGTLLLFPLAEPEKIMTLSASQATLLIISAPVTLIAFVSLSESLHHLELNRVSMILASVPLATVAAMTVCSSFFPDVLEPEQLNTLSLAGAVLVVVGTMLGSLRVGRER